ncbi:hypothetical protein CYLTODRAFT_460550 [Cylindrobasidium torrendii FP15055 ss-10]|uniref:MYND-type domain-containing protein n=1 Tax=Cylindrobasidium torrendii FP15055 ss-10 TaxID=1314674 RepID=A0A0D7ARN6_9AGAR|nr:hypothetical protein CYLTODRAFT_460550 [Cylindrobasidium torrendii FP15055 ss-10]
MSEGGHMARETTDRFEILVNLLYEVTLTFGREEDTTLLLSWCGHDLNVVRFASRVLSTDAYKNLGVSHTGMLAYIGEIFWEFAVAARKDFSDEERKSISPLIKAPPAEILDIFIDEPSIDDLRKQACARLINAALSKSCAAPGCKETTTTQDRRFQACGQCHIALYCSKQCQVAAWKHFEIPHRPICHSLKAINQKLEVDWMKIGTAARQDALWKRADRLTLQECRNIVVWTGKALMWESYSRRVPEMDAQALHNFRQHCKDWAKGFLKIDI